MAAWLESLTAPVVRLYRAFLAKRADTLYRLRHTTQVCYVEAVLNDAFDPTERRIRIADDPVPYDPIDLRLRAEAQPIPLYRRVEAQPVVLYTGTEILYGGYDFIVRIPTGLTYDGPRMTALIEYYRPAGKTYYTITEI